MWQTSLIVSAQYKGLHYISERSELYILKQQWIQACFHSLTTILKKRLHFSLQWVCLCDQSLLLHVGYNLKFRNWNKVQTLAALCLIKGLLWLCNRIFLSGIWTVGISGEGFLLIKKNFIWYLMAWIYRHQAEVYSCQLFLMTALKWEVDYKRFFL